MGAVGDQVAVRLRQALADREDGVRPGAHGEQNGHQTARRAIRRPVRRTRLCVGAGSAAAVGSVPAAAATVSGGGES
ncbi:hypothetical protein [uncultured Friedmanniella sp.]|uniref:hypothetical protein n=1 Tax=uncultured Friedmanniella sp. TaxID=335381 RepID=UPI0035CBEEA7